MAAKPASLPSWGTDTNFSSGPESGTAVKVNPSSGYKQQGFVPGLNFVGQYVNWFFNLVYQWCSYLNDGNFTGDHSISGGELIVSGQISSGSDVSASGDVIAVGDFAYAAPKTRLVMLPMSAGSESTGGAWGYSAQGNLWVTSSGTQNWVSFPLAVPSGSTLTLVRALIAKSGSHATADDRVRLEVAKQAVDKTASYGPSADTVVDADTDDGTSGYEVLDTGAISEVIDRSLNDYFIRVRSSISASLDYLHWIEVTYTEPALRTD